MRDASICISQDSAFYNHDYKDRHSQNNELETSQVIMQSQEDLDFDRGQQIPGFSFFGARDYMNKAEAGRSVMSSSQPNTNNGWVKYNNCSSAKKAQSDLDNSQDNNGGCNELP